MKNYLFIPAVAAIALASCQKATNAENIIAPTDEITVKGVSVTTKSAVNGTAFPSGYDMLVSAYRTPDSQSGDAAANYFEGIKFTKSGDGSVWKGATAKYWPSSGKLDFLCIASAGLKNGANGVAPACTWKAENVASGVTVSVPSNSAKFDDIMYGSSNGQVYSSTGNTVQFNHAQAAIVFTAKSNVAYDFEKNQGITIDSITLDGAKYSGTLTVSNPAAGGSAGDLTASWSNLGDVVDHLKARVWAAGNSGTDTAEPALSGINLGLESTSLTSKPFGDAYVLVPAQTAVPFTVTYTIHNGMKPDGKTKLDSQFSYRYTPAAGTWDMGKKHVYDINITLNEVNINPSITDWINQTAVNVPVGQ